MFFRSRRKSPFKVIAIIHGGGYIIGGTAAPFENAAPLAGIGDVIIVSLNYRLGIFGFADMKEFAPANLGLHDQRMALQWIQDHVADFGGDPDKVTVMGVSAGSMSIAAQIITPIDDKNLFRSVVMDAGVVTSNGFHESSESSYTRLTKIARHLGCPVDSSAMVDCLRETSVEKLLPLAVNTTGSTEITSFVATTDGVFIPRNVEKYAEENSEKLRKVRTIIGYALNEGTFFMGRTFITFDYPNPETKEETLEYCKKLSRWYDYRLDFSTEKTEILISKLYLNTDTPRNAVAAFQSDGIFKCPINKFIRSYAEHNEEVYVYQFNRKLKATYADLFDPDMLGAFHYSPYLHFSGAWFKNTEPVNPIDEQFSLEAMHLISGFAKGDESLEFRGVTWPRFSEWGEIFIFDETPFVQKGQPSEQSCRELFSASDPTKYEKDSIGCDCKDLKSSILRKTTSDSTEGLDGSCRTRKTLD